MDKIYEFYYDPRAPFKGSIYELHVEQETEHTYSGGVYYVDASGALVPRGNFRLSKSSVDIVMLTYRHVYLVRVLADDVFKSKRKAVKMLSDFMKKQAELVGDSWLWSHQDELAEGGCCD